VHWLRPLEIHAVAITSICVSCCMSPQSQDRRLPTLRGRGRGRGNYTEPPVVDGKKCRRRRFCPGASLLVGRDQSLSSMKMRLNIAGIIASAPAFARRSYDGSFGFIRPICREGSRRPGNSTL
jgi:hypothetical protein